MQCERCPWEDTIKCESCTPEKKENPKAAGVEEAIKYFEYDLESFRMILKERVEQSVEYRATRMAVEALKRLSE